MSFDITNNVLMDCNKNTTQYDQLLPSSQTLLWERGQDNWCGLRTDGHCSRGRVFYLHVKKGKRRREEGGYREDESSPGPWWGLSSGWALCPSCQP